MFSVYCHENKANGKTYVGITGQDPKHRWLNGVGYSRNKKFYADIQKYGWEGFNHRIVCNGLTEEQAVAIEKEMIAAYDARNLGYNNDDGGKYVPKRVLNHNANELKRAIKKSSCSSFAPCKAFLEILSTAELEGKESQLCKNVNLFTDDIIDKFCKDGRPVLYSDPTFITDFLWEWQRIWAIHKWVHDNNITEYDESVDIDSMFPPYNSVARYEITEKCLLEGKSLCQK